MENKPKRLSNQGYVFQDLVLDITIVYSFIFIMYLVMKYMF